MRGPDDHLLDSPDRDLLRVVTGVEPDKPGKHAILPGKRGRSTQRIGLGDVGGGIVVFTWPGELAAQARRLYDGERAPRLLTAARMGSWSVDLRPHLAFWLSRPPERLYMHPTPALTPEQYASRWAGEDADKIGGHDLETVRDELWPWLIDRGYATVRDTELLEPFLERVGKRNRDVHLRPGLALMRRWELETVDALRRRGRLAEEIREAISGILAAADDPPLPAASG